MVCTLHGNRMSLLFMVRNSVIHFQRQLSFHRIQFYFLTTNDNATPSFATRLDLDIQFFTMRYAE